MSMTPHTPCCKSILQKNKLPTLHWRSRPQTSGTGSIKPSAPPPALTRSVNSLTAPPKKTMTPNYQDLLFPYAYNILGSTEDARDAIQDVITNYYSQPRDGVTNEKAYLIKSVINRAINK